MTLAAEAPDLGVLGNFKGPVFGFAHHRGFTHSFLGLFLGSAVVVGFMYLVWRLRGKKIKDPHLPPRWGLLYLFSLVAGLTHILLDFTNGYGVRPFWPFSERWYSWDIVFIIDPIIYALTVVDSLGPEVDPDGDMRIRYKPEETPVTLAAKRSYLGRVYLDWARYPVTETEEIRNPRPGYVVQFQDLRFAYPERRGANLLRGGVQLDRNLNIVTETFGSRGKQLPD